MAFTFHSFSQASASAKLFLALHTAWGIPPIYIVTAAN